MAQNPITVFGGSGFLGRSVVARLADEGRAVRVAVRRPEAVAPSRPGVAALRADVREAGTLAPAVEGADGVVNAVGLYVERRGETFANVHVEGARRVAEAARRAGVAALVHVSGIGADPGSESTYVRARAAGEAAVREAFPEATIVRPSVLFGPGDAFFTTLARIARLTPAFPLFGRGEVRLQPVYVGDVAAAVATALADPAARGRTYELGGPRAYTYRELVELLLRRIGVRRPLIPVPLALWEVQARLLSVLPAPPLTRDQVALMRIDNVPAPDMPGFADLNLEPAAVEDVLPTYMPSDGPTS